mmetsp:Transcript_13060/g.25316  ORF Transcript_13060/g.25316 Transcript_13060/m.25316 type:complete len:511 (-) Transcript_13060:336-1868(-)|eukprot:CAMPEP_0175120426 /NCGR_PEP_ID=MMETSP0087-20121206/616_1 /TAXON_ID=136419 /ORGANISM="Unknown Unknown, Strain D1" /LENGTH=510 /DNA_ID=CAMNT_0016401875 /DNA_START=71 /DNA_END=1603 /DNA_ORIENTATION=+
MKFRSVMFFGAVATAGAVDCSTSDQDKIDCGFVGINATGCQAKGCCWQQSGTSGIPWCFFPKGTGNCFKPSSAGGKAPFTDDQVSTMEKYFQANINIQGSGAVVAAPDHNTPGGSYYYHWERDGALTMRAVFELYGANQEDELKSYTNWVLKVQNQADPNSQDVRTEPKYTIPDGKPYTGGWCRPQTDGPALRAQTLMAFGNYLRSNGGSDYVKANLWTGSSQYNGGAIKYDLDWVADNWQSSGCDLWEEIRSTDFFWNRMAFKRAMQQGAKFAALLGDSDSASRYTKVAQSVIDVLPQHYQNGFVIEEQNRQVDGATIVAFNDGYLDGDSDFGPTDSKVADTVKKIINVVCEQYPINQADTKNNIAGVMLGRYPGDTYAGGNPWILTSSALAQLFYRGASAVLTNRSSISEEAMGTWLEIFGIPAQQKLSTLQLAQAFSDSGDGVLERVAYHVAGDGFHLDEQIDKNTGAQCSAKDLTWSYAETLMAMSKRKQFYQLREQFKFNVTEAW